MRTIVSHGTSHGPASLAAFLFLFLFAFCLAVPSATAAERDPVIQGVVEQGKAEAATLLNQGKAMEAYRLYSRLLRESPEDLEVNLGLARSSMLAGRHHQAIMAYERLLEDYPGDPVLLKEIAHAYTVIGDTEKARRYLRNDPTLDEESTADLMDALGRRYDRFQIHGRLSAGVLFDDNANQGPASNIMDLGNWRGVEIPNAAAKETFGGFASGLLDMGYRLGQVSSWWLVGDMNFYVRGNTNNKLGTSNNRFLDWYKASAGIRRMGPDTLLDIRVKGELFDNEWYHAVYAVGPELSFAYAPTPWLQLISRASMDQRDYVRDRQRNGNYGYAGQYARFFFGENLHEFVVGARYIGGRPERHTYAYDGWELLASFNFKLPYGFELAPSISYTKEYYRGAATVFESKKREDERIRAGVGLTYRINKDWTLESFYQYTNNNSTSNYSVY
ncbi:tetratricopeptide repeat protein, partial [Desulfovibrio sp. OttesenSCG-928-I05]|nr:tetratricopeptide repeat protein [Desulfovibrio sp. OttesenSCG-928-I05]